MISNNKLVRVLLVTLFFLFVHHPTSVDAGPAAYGICQAGCAAVVTACYAAGGAVFGTVTAGKYQFQLGYIPNYTTRIELGRRMK
jgi:hypothetical protein